jgi:hypothetical protein
MMRSGAFWRMKLRMKLPSQLFEAFQPAGTLFNTLNLG